MYTIVKHIHLTAIIISLILFSLRFVWALRASPLLQKKWVKVVPHINDTILLASALGLCVIIAQYPFVDAWLTQKVIGIILYILMGLWTLKWANTALTRSMGFVGAIVIIGLTAKIAVFKQPLFL